MIATSGLRLVLAAAILAAGAVSLVPPTAAEAAGDCSVDTFTVDAKPVTVTLCPSPLKLAADKTGVVTVAETIGGGGGSFDRTSELDFFAGETTSRSIEDVPLAKLGVAKTLHLTIGYKGGAIHIEHALLVPGAIPLK